MHNSMFWEKHFRMDFVPSTHRVVEVFLERLVPTFGNAALETDLYTQRLWADATSAPWDANPPDEPEIAEMVQAAGIEHYLALKGFEQGILNCCALFLFHLFEQHLMLFHRKEMLRRSEENVVALINRRELERRLESSGISFTLFKDWSTLEELRLLANSLKHGEGSSSRALHSIAPDLFRSPSVSESHGVVNPSAGRVYTPLLGEGIFVTVEKIREYEAAIQGCWLELADKLASS